MKTLSFVLILFLLGIGRTWAQESLEVGILLPDTVTCITSPIDLSGEFAPGMPHVGVSGGIPPYYAIWSPTNGVSDSTILTPIINPDTTTTYTLIAYDSGGNIDTAYYTVRVVNNYNDFLGAATYNAGCAGSTGSIEMYAQGPGVPHGFTYQWSNGFTGKFQENLVPGIYTITATDLHGCTSVLTDTITTGHITLDLKEYSNVCTAAVYALLSTFALEPVVYSWSNGQITDSSHIHNLFAGIYSVTVTDAIGCSGTATTNVSAFEVLKVDSIFITPAPCSTNISPGCIYVSGGIPPYTYLWLNMMQNNQCFTSAGYSTVDYRITDASGCVLDTSIYVPSANNLSIRLIPDTAYYTRPDSVVISINGGTPPYTYWWAGSTDTTPVYYTDSNDFFVLAMVKDANDCYAMDTIIVGGCDSTCKWPGDANYDGIADNTDLLQIGLGYNLTGTNDYYWADLEWRPHPIRNWDTASTDGVNFKHADCNGDGTINADDTIAILLNYGLTHPRSGEQEWRADIPALNPIVLNDTITNGDTLVVDLVLGDALNPATDVYGIAFTLNYDMLTVDTTLTRITFGDSWLGDATDKISISKDITDVGQIKCGITRIDHANRSGNGAIGTAIFVITTDNINGKDLSYYTSHTWISDITAIDRAGNSIDINAGRDSAAIGYEITGINDIAWADKINLYPNPASNTLNINSPQVIVNTVAITNVLGEQLMLTNVSANKASINIEILQPGIYFTELNTDKGTFTKRLFVTR